MRRSLPALCLLAAPTFALSQQPGERPAQLATHSVIAEAHQAGNFDGVVVLSANGQVVFSEAVGLADRGTRRPLTPASVFRLASLTKQVTALLVMQEVEAGHMRLDQRAGELLPALPDATARVTVRQLLQHVSGLANPSEGPDNVVPPFYQSTGADAADARTNALGACSAKATREPGKQFEYNNCDFIVLGALLEAETGTPYPTLLRQRVIDKLGLKSWRLFGFGPDPAGLALTYQTDGQPDLFQNPATYGAAGGLYGSALDVAKWNEALLHHTLLSAKATETMFTSDPKLYGEALGSWTYDSAVTRPPTHIVERQGEMGGMHLLNLLLPGRNASVVIIANTERADLFNTYTGKGLGYAVLNAWLATP